MFSKFFIQRPIFATVISLIIVIAGLVSMQSLAVEEYPQVVPPEVSVEAYYPGASAKTIASSVAAPIEEQINGVENMLYMSSTSSSSGRVSIHVTFKLGTDPDQAAINVNNRVQAALPSLPSEVQATGVSIRKNSASMLEVLTLGAKDSAYTPMYLANYALINIIDELKRVPGVGDAHLFGGRDYAMKIWLKPDKLAQYNLTPNDVITAIREQNSQFAVGKFNEEPSSTKQAFTYTVTTKGRLTSPKEFGNIILVSNKNGATIRVKNVAKVELGSESYAVNSKLNGKIAIPFAINLQSGANALETAQRVKATMDKLAKSFPNKMQYKVAYDTTKFISISIEEVVQTFFEAMILVILVIYMFLQNIRATIIPLIAVPVSIIGTFTGMYFLGFSINLLTLFGLVLAIGIVVDDAIVVIENTERILHEEKDITVKGAAIKAMQEVTGPVVAIVLVLCAVFIPVTFMGGFSGQMYKQFATTIVISVVISGIVALTLTPALCGVFLKKIEPKPFFFVRKFNEFFDRSSHVFTATVRKALRHLTIVGVIFVILMGLMYTIFTRVPSSLVPMEDQGVLLAVTMLPEASTLTRTSAIMDRQDKIVLSNPNVESAMSVGGFDLFSGSAKTSSGISFISLKDWSLRTKASQSSAAVAMQLNMALSRIGGATIFALNPPPIMGLSLTGGFEMYIEDRAGTSIEELAKYTNIVTAAANRDPKLSRVRTTLNVSVPQYEVKLDRDKAKALGVSVTSVFSALQATFGSYYVNDFNLFGKTYKVNVQSDLRYRKKARDLKNVFVRSSSDKLIPISALVSYKRSVGPDLVERFNGFPAAKIMGSPAKGYTSGDALDAIAAVAKKVLPQGYTVAWVGTSYQEKSAQGTGSSAFVYGMIFVFLILAAQYERWLIPFAVVTAVPFAVLGAIGAVYLRGLNNGIYFQIGLLVLMGLSAKNAILIVEFAMMAQKRGKSVFDATLEAARLRFRPIVMTSLAFTFGVIPLMLSSGAGSGSRHAIGTAVVGGMIIATSVGLVFIPFFYFIFAKINEHFMAYMARRHEKHEIKAKLRSEENEELRQKRLDKKKKD